MSIKREDFITVIRAIQIAKEQTLGGSYTKLFLTKENKLKGIEYDRIVEIIETLRKDGLIEINHLPKQSELLADHSPHEKVFPMNYFSIRVNEKFDEFAKETGFAIHLLGTIPKSRKYSVLRKLLKLLVDNKKIDNYYLARTFIRKTDNQSKRTKINKNDYKANQAKYNQKIRNRLKTLRNFLESEGYKIVSKKEATFLVKTTKVRQFQI